MNSLIKIHIHLRKKDAQDFYQGGQEGDSTQILVIMLL